MLKFENVVGTSVYMAPPDILIFSFFFSEFAVYAWTTVWIFSMIQFVNIINQALENPLMKKTALLKLY